MVTRHSTSVAIVGAGASGALTAIQLLRRAHEQGEWIEVRLVDPDAATGRGIAYGTSDPSHLLNVAASRLSAVAADPQHFLRWLCAHKGVRHPDAFVPRSWFGEYVEATLVEAVTSANARLERIARQGDRDPPTRERMHDPPRQRHALPVQPCRPRPGKSAVARTHCSRRRFSSRRDSSATHGPTVRSTTCAGDPATSSSSARG